MIHRLAKGTWAVLECDAAGTAFWGTAESWSRGPPSLLRFGASCAAQQCACARAAHRHVA